jgi:hypothetical protein
MNERFTFIIQEKYYQRYKKIAAFVFGIHAFIFAFMASASGSVPEKLILFICAALLIIYTSYTWLYKKKKEKSYMLMYLLMAAVWILNTPFWYFSLIYPVLLFLQFRMESDFSILFDEEAIVIRGLFSEKYKWQQMNNVILKDGLLTLDFVNNRIMQVEPDWNASFVNKGIIPGQSDARYAVTEREFNDFCRRQFITPNK